MTRVYVYYHIKTEGGHLKVRQYPFSLTKHAAEKLSSRLLRRPRVTQVTTSSEPLRWAKALRWTN